MKRAIITTAAICAVLCMGVMAEAQSTGDFQTRDVNGTHSWNSTSLWQVYNGGWSDTATWPTDNTKNVTIRTPSSSSLVVQVNITNAAAAQLTVQTSTVVSILTNQCLEIAGNSSVADANGIVLDSTGSKLKVSNDLTISGTGELYGGSTTAEIQIADTKTLTSEITIEGALKIKEVTPATESATFINNGLVDANINGTLEVATDTISDDTGRRWSLDDDDARLLFSADATGNNKLVGNFDIDAGTLDIDANITTSGTLDQAASTTSTIDVAAGKTFQAS